MPALATLLPVPGRLLLLVLGLLPACPQRRFGSRTPGTRSRVGGGASGRQKMHSGFHLKFVKSPGIVVACVPQSISFSIRGRLQWTQVHVCGPMTLAAGALPKFMYTMMRGSELR